MIRIKRSLADKLFSDYIRLRDGYRCQRCKVLYAAPTTALHCSHFFGRGNKAVRWDPDNACALCYGCHQFLGSRPYEHSQFFEKRLGKISYDRLVLRAHQPTKVDKKLVVIQMKALLKDLESKDVIYGKH